MAKPDHLDGTLGLGVPNDAFGADPSIRTFAEADTKRAATVPTIQPQADAPPPPPKKLVHRRPLWVFIQLPPDGESAPIYSAYRCAGVEEVRKHLADHKIDAADIDKRAIIFRADPVEVKIKTQLLIKF